MLVSEREFIDLTRWNAECDLPGVGRLSIRALTPDDLELERRFIESLSPETLRMRVLGAVKGVTEDQLAQLVRFDWSRELALAAIRRAGEDFLLPARVPAVQPGVDELVSVARIAPSGAPGVAEFAIVVGDRYQGLGLGEEMMRRIRDAAGVMGYRTLQGSTMAANERMLGLAERLGFGTSPDPEDSSLVLMRCPTQALRRSARRSRAGMRLSLPW
jgi:acetyltransferase